MKAQQYLQTYYAQRGEQRGNHARRASGRPRSSATASRSCGCSRRSWRSCERTSSPASASATVYEASGRKGLVDVELRQFPPGARACGPARIARCGQDDNLMVHAVMALGAARRRARAHDARAGARRAARRSARHPGRGPPGGRGARRRRHPRLRGARRSRSGRAGSATAARPRRSRGELDVPVVVGGAEIRPGDLVVLDADGVTVVPIERAEEVLEASLAREAKEADKRAKLAGGRALLRAGRARRELTSRISARSRSSPRASTTALAFFVDILGMDIEAQDGPSTYLRGWGDYQRWSVKLTAERDERHGRARPARVEPRGVAAARRGGRGHRARDRLDRRRPRPRPVVSLPRPRRPRLRALLRVRALRRPPRTASPPTRTCPAATPAAAARSSASTTSTSSPPTSAPTASSASTR